MTLKEYKKKRDFKKTPEPEGILKEFEKNIFVVQKHQASKLHYDFRIEIESVLKSWAVPKGPSLNPKDKRLAIETEDHPLDYANFEGVIPENNYGAGTVMLWDRGTYENETQINNESIPIKEAYKKGHITIQLNGKKLKGSYSLIKMGQDNKWLLIKKDDSNADRKIDILEQENRSIISNKTIEEIEETHNEE